jgi:hypothetical protein
MPTPHRLAPLAACVAAAFALLPANADAGTVTLPVTSCLDHGNGTLRSAIAQANMLSDDVVIDLTLLNCTISLTTGAIASTKDFLVLRGPGANKVTINGNYSSRVLTHNATGGLFIYDLDIAEGRVQTAQSDGGCIYSSSSVTLVRSNVSYCSTLATSGTKGGAIYAKTAVVLNGGNAVFHSLAYSSGGEAYGGAIYAPEVFVSDSTVSSSQVLTPGGNSFGGGITTSTLFAFGSTIDNNRAAEGGGVFINTQGSGVISESTISGNTASECGGGVYSKYQLTLKNSTIAFNHALQQDTMRSCIGGGLYSGLQAKSVTLQSTIIANNRGGPAAADFASDFDAPSGPGNSANTISGTNNLVVVTDGGSRAPPGDSLHTDPQLLPLRGNGGHTRTHALVATSPAINHGNNSANDDNDQRGSGFARAIGTADVGAFEFDPDVIFRNGFD